MTQNVSALIYGDEKKKKQPKTLYLAVRQAEQSDWERTHM